MDRAGQNDDALHGLARQVVAASEAFVSAWAQAAQSASPRLSNLQLQALLIARRTPGINLTAFSEAAGATPPTASRLCDRLEAAGLLRREPVPARRREIGLTLTPHGHQVVDALLDRRSSAIHDVLCRMTAVDRVALLSGLLAFSEVAGGEDAA